MLKFENLENGRYYYLQVHKDLLDDLVLTVIRGGKGIRVVQHFGYKCLIELDKRIREISKRRLQRGYVMLTRDNK